MPTPATNVHYVLECRRGPHVHYIPIPRPIRLRKAANRTENPKAAIQPIVACPECGLASVYSALDIQTLLSPMPDPFEAGICHLVALEVECGDKNCESPATIHTTIGSDKGVWKEKVVPINWGFDSTCRCENGHQLKPTWEDNRFAWERRELLF